MNRTEEWNVSNLFLVPLLDLKRYDLYALGFMSSYLFNGEEEDNYEWPLYLSFMPPDMEKFNDFISREQDRPKIVTYLDERQYKDIILLTYLLPLEFREDYDKIMEGQYSKLSEDFRALFENEVEIYDHVLGKTVLGKSLQMMIFDKDETLRKDWELQLGVFIDSDTELWKKPNKDKETFKVSNYDRKADIKQLPASS